MAGSTFSFLEAAPVSVRSRAAVAESDWAATLACSAEVHSLVPEIDLRVLVDELLALVVDSPSPGDDFLAAVAGSHAPGDNSRERAAGSPGRADVRAADSLARVGGPEVELLVPAADFRAWVAALADSAEVHSHAPEADSLGWAGEPGVELLVPAADFRAWPAALADSAAVHSHAPAVDSREPVARPGSPELARSRALAVDCRVPLVSQAVPRSAYSAALPAGFLLRAAAADWLALLQLCLPAALVQASHSSQCETRSVWVSSGRQELLEPKEPSSLRLVCSQAFPEDAPMVSQQH